MAHTKPHPTYTDTPGMAYARREYRHLLSLIGSLRSAQATEICAHLSDLIGARDRIAYKLHVHNAYLDQIERTGPGSLPATLAKQRADHVGPVDPRALQRAEQRIADTLARLPQAAVSMIKAAADHGFARWLETKTDRRRLARQMAADDEIAERKSQGYQRDQTAVRRAPMALWRGPELWAQQRAQSRLDRKGRKVGDPTGATYTATTIEPSDPDCPVGYWQAVPIPDRSTPEHPDRIDRVAATRERIAEIQISSDADAILEVQDWSTSPRYRRPDQCTLALESGRKVQARRPSAGAGPQDIQGPNPHKRGGRLANSRRRRRKHNYP